MALISCSECGKKVSDKAQACPECGNPIADSVEVKAIGTSVTTTQETSKAIKSHMVLATLMILGGCSVSIASAGSQSSGGTTLGIWLMLIGFIWYLVARVRGWWHHG